MQLEENNRLIYKCILRDNDYILVRFNPENGAVVAIHRKHDFDPTIGIFEIPRGDYERIVTNILFDYGKSVLLDSEKSSYGVKVSEGLLDGKKFDIKGIEGTGKNNIINHFKDVSKKGSEIIVFYYHSKDLFSKKQIKAGYQFYCRNSKSQRIKTVYYIVDKRLYLI